MGEMVRAVETGLMRDFLHGKRGAVQEAFRFVQPELQLVLMRRKARVFTKGMAKPGITYVQVPSQ